MTNSNVNVTGVIPRISKRNIAWVLIFSIVMYGLFCPFWIINDTKKLPGNIKITTLPLKLSIIMSFLFYIFIFINSILGIMDSVIIFGRIVFYMCCLNYRIGNGLYLAGQQYNKSVTDYSILY